MKNSIFILSAFLVAAKATQIPSRHLQITRAVANVSIPDPDDYEIQESDIAEFVQDEDEHGEGWQDITSHGMMVFDNEVSPVEHSSLVKRGLGVRDVARREVDMHLTERGDLVYSATWTQGIKNTMARAVKRGSKSFKATITWYTGYDLKYPNCCDRSGFTPTDSSLIAATTLNGWKDQPKCGAYLKLRAKNGKKSVIVRKIDTCGGCKTDSKHVDLTKAAFKALYSLDTGLVRDIQVQQVGKPFKKYTSKMKKLYGPEKL